VSWIYTAEKVARVTILRIETHVSEFCIFNQ
jgi:hypothetical protein